MKGTLLSGIGLVLALTLVQAISLAVSHPAALTAAPLPQRTRQPSSNTATPRITLPTRTPTASPSAGATRRGPTAQPTAGAAVTDSPVATAVPGGSGQPGGTAAPGGTEAGGGRGAEGTMLPPTGPEDGGGRGPPVIGAPALPGSPSLPGSPTLPGESEQGASGVSGGAGTADPGAVTGAELGGGSRSGPGGDPKAAGAMAPAESGPSGLLRVPVPDPRLRALWAEGGSPRQGQGLAERFTAARPGPWGFAWFYPLLVAGFGVVVWKLWGALRALDGERDETEERGGAVDGDGPDDSDGEAERAGAADRGSVAEHER